MFMMSFPFRNKYWTFNNHIFTHLEHNVGFNNGLRTTTFNVGITEEPGIAFRPSNLELELRPRYALHTSTTSSRQTSAGLSTISEAVSTQPTICRSDSAYRPICATTPREATRQATTPTSGCGTPS